MAFMMCYKKDDHFVLACDNRYNYTSGLLPRLGTRQCRIQKFKNFYIAYSGTVLTFMHLVKEFDFDTFPEPLTFDYIVNEFYPKFLKFAVTEGEAKVEKGILRELSFSIMIMGRDYAYDICDEYPYPINQYGINANGNDAVAFALNDIYKNEIKTEQGIWKIFREIDETYTESGFPFIVVSSTDMKPRQFFKDGHIEDMPPLEDFTKEKEAK